MNVIEGLAPYPPDQILIEVERDMQTGDVFVSARVYFTPSVAIIRRADAQSDEVIENGIVEAKKIVHREMVERLGKLDESERRMTTPFQTALAAAFGAAAMLALLWLIGRVTHRRRE